MLKVKLLRQLDGRSAGETAEYPELDARHLAELGVVEIVKDRAMPEPEQKAAEPVENKAAPEPENKSAPKPKGRTAN